MKVNHITASDLSGGAARAAYRIHQSLLHHGALLEVQSQMRVLQKLSNDPTVIGNPLKANPLWRRIRPRIINQVYRNFNTQNPVLHSVAFLKTGLGKELSDASADIFHLHWLGNNTLSVEEIGKLSQPLVWTLHDQWAFCGAEHYVNLPPFKDERYIEGYTADNRPPHERGPDLNRWTWQRKRQAWQKPIHIVCPSNWMADCARKSALMKDWPIVVIPNPIDLETWSPFDQTQARKVFNLPVDSPLILFGALGGTSDPRKGSDLLQFALHSLKTQVADTPLSSLELVVFGQNRPQTEPDFGFPVHYMGHLHDDVSLRLLYSSADVMVLPSRLDNLPNTGLEAHACGTPVVAFRYSGLTDVVTDGVTGILAEPFEPESLAQAILTAIEDPDRQKELGSAARAKAEQLWAPLVVAKQYAEVYRSILSQSLGSYSSPRPD